MPRTKSKQLSTLPRDAQFVLDRRLHLVVAHWPRGVEVVPVTGWADTRVLPADTIVRVAA